MQIRLFLSLAIWTTAVALNQQLEGQLYGSVPYSTSSVQGSTIITNYYDPNAVNSGPGLPTTPLQSRFTGPLDQAGQNTGYQAPTLGQPSGFPQAPIQQPLLSQPYANQNYGSQPGPTYLNQVPNNTPSGLPSRYEDPTYPYPGLMTIINGKWVGSDYLYDLPRDIGIVIEIIKPGNKQIDIDTRRLRDMADALFTQANIHPESLAIGNDPPLPFFHILIFAYPDEDKCTAAIAGRLFEKVKISRLNFNIPGTTQAITWEKLDLIITSTLQFQDQLAEAVREIVSSFLNRVRFFEEEKIKQDSGFRLLPAVPKYGQKKHPQKNDCCCY